MLDMFCVCVCVCVCVYVLYVNSGVARYGPGWTRAHPNFSLRQQHPLSIAITSKKQVVHTLAVPYFVVNQQIILK